MYNIIIDKTDNIINDLKNFLKNNNLYDNKQRNNIITWGLPKKVNNNYKKKKKICNDYENHIIIERGFIKRDMYFSLGLNGFANFSKTRHTQCLSDRFNQLDINVKSYSAYSNENGYILICGQVPWDTQVQDINYCKWLENLFSSLLKITKRKIVFRPHPTYTKLQKKNHSKPKLYKYKVFNGIFIDKIESIEESLKDAYCVIAYNSTSLIDAVIQGIPIFAMNEMSLVYNLSNNNIKNIEDLYIPSDDKQLQTLYDISYMQYTKLELFEIFQKHNKFIL